MLHIRGVFGYEIFLTAKLAKMDDALGVLLGTVRLCLMNGMARSMTKGGI